MHGHNAGEMGGCGVNGDPEPAAIMLDLDAIALAKRWTVLSHDHQTMSKRQALVLHVMSGAIRYEPVATSTQGTFTHEARVWRDRTFWRLAKTACSTRLRSRSRRVLRLCKTVWWSHVGVLHGRPHEHGDGSRSPLAAEQPGGGGS